MASMVAENWENILDGHDCSESFELSPRNHHLLMSLLDETQIDDCDDDDERLTKVIQSLQAELDSADDCDLVDCQSSVDESYGEGCPMATNDLDLHWMDVEIMPTSPSWYNMDHHHGQGMMMTSDEFGWIKNPSFSPIEADQDYGSLWHGTNALL
ncbi:hypothetical protein C2S51_037840 [Perilla frutescens var. frutescens]|nr:hypothetical protein C2S51_037840 [Perilla frutescens var. frutescens]